VALLTTCGPQAQAATDRNADELVSILDHAAIVQQMVRSCREARPELADAFEAARGAWWSRNAEVSAAIKDLRHDPGGARGREFLAYYEGPRHVPAGPYGSPARARPY
jgi:hypothetical protein